ncbi:hypothetical protein AVDCRST_MAG84-3569, partial [uncultured Microcoleus sp.]
GINRCQSSNKSQIPTVLQSKIQNQKSKVVCSERGKNM